MSAWHVEFGLDAGLCVQPDAETISNDKNVKTEIRIAFIIFFFSRHNNIRLNSSLI
jgi:hypothetical protein